jgi:hypothetical protein
VITPSDRTKLKLGQQRTAKKLRPTTGQNLVGRNGSNTTNTSDLFGKRISMWIYIVLTGVYVVWSMHNPVAIYTTASHDDALFWTQAQNLISGKWLGEYNQMTMAKGPSFSFFLALNYLLGTPITLFVAVFYAFASWVLVRELKRVGLNRWLGLLSYSLILFHPSMIPTRVIRDNIYPSLTLIALAGVLRLLTIKSLTPHNLFITSMFGISLGFFWLTREEGVWVAITVLMLTAWSLWNVRRNAPSRKALILTITTMVISAGVIVGSVGLLNFYSYGKFTVNDFRDSSFSRAVKVLESVREGPEQAYLPVSEQKRKLLYRISPTFAELKPFLDDDPNFWREPGCRAYPDTCGDIAGGWWRWALRDAASRGGYYTNPQSADAFYRRLTSEVASACESGRIGCFNNPIPVLPIISNSQLQLIPKTFIHAMHFLVLPKRTPSVSSSVEPLHELNLIRLFLGNPRTTPALSEQSINLSGWFRASDQSWMELVCEKPVTDTGQVIPIKKLNSPDVAEYFNDPKAASIRFNISVPLGEKCSIRRTGTSTMSVKMITLESLSAPGTGYSTLGEDSRLQIDQIKSLGKISSWPGTVKGALMVAYKLLMLLFVPAGLLALFLAVMLGIIRREKATSLPIIAVALWIAIGCRLFIVSLIDVTSFPAINFLYLGPCIPILILTSIISLQVLNNSFKISEARRLGDKLPIND